MVFFSVSCPVDISPCLQQITTTSPDREQPNEIPAPINYQALQPHHLDQVHDLLTRVFWSGIDGSFISTLQARENAQLFFDLVSESLCHSPERSSVIATYKKLVVGVAFLSSPQEPYITYLAVKAGWENAQIAT
jgi:hypothetical protein